jgi:membrane protein
MATIRSLCSNEPHPRDVQLTQFKSAVVRTYADIQNNRALQMAAALSYYFVMALFPALIFLSAIVAFLPVAGLFDQTLDLMGRFVPPEGMDVVRKVLAEAITPNRGTFLSIGFLGTLWTASGGFTAAIEALNIAYDAHETRPFWRSRLLAIVLVLVIGLLLLVALSVMIVGPHFGQWLANRMHLSRVWLWVWPYVHWLISVGFTVLAVEALYFMGPNVKQRFRATLPGAVLSVGFWIGLSYLLGIYFRTFANFNKTYGTLGAGIALMVWLYWTGFAMLVGAELNAELAKRTREGAIEQKQEDQSPPAPSKMIA